MPQYDNTTNRGYQKPHVSNAGTEDVNRLRSALDAIDAEIVVSNTTGITGADRITNIVSLTQAEYDAIGSPSATTLYVITD